METATSNVAMQESAMSSPGDPTKQRLQERKAFCCGVADRLRGQAGPVADEQGRYWLANTLTAAADLGDELLNDRRSPLHTPAARWVFWTTPDGGARSLGEIAEDCCAEACAALEAYCDLLEKPLPAEREALLARSARAVWNGQRCFSRILALAGVEAPGSL